MIDNNDAESREPDIDETVPTDPDMAEIPMDPASPEFCKFPHCDKTKLRARGLCLTHYLEARKLILDPRFPELTSWEQLEQTGRAGKGRKNRFRDWLLGDVEVLLPPDEDREYAREVGTDPGWEDC